METLVKRHPAPHVSSQGGKHKHKSANTILLQRVKGRFGSAVEAIKDALGFKPTLPTGIGPYVPFISETRQRKKRIMLKMGITSGKTFRRHIKRLKRSLRLDPAI